MTEYENPVKRGFYPDPSVIRVEDDFYMVNSSFQYFPAIPISHSKDLVHWKTVAHAVNDPEYLDLSHIKDSRGIWAPDIVYSNGKYYIFATLRYNDDHKPMRRQLVTCSEHPQGPYSKPWFLDIDNIDPSLFVDDDGSHYIVTAPGATVTPVSPDCREIIGPSRCVWEGIGERCPEGPHIFKRNGYYYAVVASGGTGYGHGIIMARSKSLFGEYEPSPYNPLLRQNDPEALIQRSGHGDFITDKNGNWYCLYLCGRRNGGNYTTLGRETALENVTWNSDNWCTVGSGVPSEKASLPLEEYIQTEEEYFDFKCGIPESFQWVRVSAKHNYDNGIVLFPSDEPEYSTACSCILLHRETELNTDVEVSFDYNTSKNSHAGLICYYSTATYIRFSVFENGLQLVVNKNNGEEIIKLENIFPSTLGVRVRGLEREFYYITEEKEKVFCKIENCTFLSDEGVPEDKKRHTGTLSGISCIGSAPIRIKYFKIRGVRS